MLLLLVPAGTIQILALTDSKNISEQDQSVKHPVKRFWTWICQENKPKMSAKVGQDGPGVHPRFQKHFRKHLLTARKLTWTHSLTAIDY